MSEPASEDAWQDVSADRGRRLSFGAVAELYDRHRPGYPAAMVDAVIEYGGLRPGDRVLDVGAGTGKATLLFAQRGHRVTAIEPDGAMAAVASKRAATAGHSVEILESDFESAELEPGGFRAVISGTAWHWVAPAVRERLAAQVLGPGGTLAPFWNRPRWEGNPLRPGFDRAYAPLAEDFAASPVGLMNPSSTRIELDDAAGWLENGAGEFTDVDARIFSWEERYTTEEYIGLLSTQSDHLMLAGSSRERLFDAIRATIDAAGGSFELTYETLLCLTRRPAT